MNDDEIVCGCLNLTVKDIKDAVKNGAKSFEEVQEATEVGTACGACVDEVTELVNELLQK
ncbi:MULTISPECIES: (2Fe-2S)-binding protein [Clostridium]|uniref:(2Fe-2S)-binding protein n=1 Tax=Clostridium TaxID=1485 RepID=UPI000824CE93|nr:MULTISPECIES: (2Fe-2S)-binding protein [Clostridium]PJI06790.1 (2Fe-2S)-binding protein [Clostridium sp. CT7]